ncbi:MAG: endonuclease/exonuclease/phosphatase family protein [Planctomycetota bacterium]|nr:endonuclease/exonuclease/phosphatase family protein [Planctomycetota bacterium]
MSTPILVPGAGSKPLSRFKLLLAAPLLASAVLSACESSRPADASGNAAAATGENRRSLSMTSEVSDSSATAAAPAGLNVRVTLDGTIEEWPSESAVLADEHFLYTRLRVKDETFTLQSADETTAIWLDADADANTGKRVRLSPTTPELGVDLEVQFSPLDAETKRPGRGTAIFALDNSGARSPVARSRHDDLAFAPTYAANWYEIRLSRHIVSLPQAFPGAGLRSRGGVRGAAVLLDSQGALAGWSEPFAATLPPRSEVPLTLEATLPSASRGQIRVISYNVERSKPVETPAPFQAVFQALKPDAILVQEWNSTPEELQSWFTALVPNNTGWHVVVGPSGVAVVSRFPLQTIDTGTRVRVAAAIADTEFGPVGLASLHLKCCGSKDSPEDQRRLDEARSVNAALAKAWNDAGVVTRFVGGDLNLVGSRPPLDALRSSLAAPGTIDPDLRVAEPMVLGDRAMFTWADVPNEFTPGRLDYILYSGGRVEQTFVLDLSRLSTDSLASMGFSQADLKSSDHLPVVVDLTPTLP